MKVNQNDKQILDPRTCADKSLFSGNSSSIKVLSILSLLLAFGTSVCYANSGKSFSLLIDSSASLKEMQETKKVLEKKLAANGFERLSIQVLENGLEVRFSDVSKVDFQTLLQKQESERFHRLAQKHFGRKFFLRAERKAVASPVIMAALRGSAIRVSSLSNGNIPFLLKSIFGGDVIAGQLQINPS